ncbi:hypothetical protein ACL02U_11870 [Streptomyces sp. MS06]|uniref:hypothetical protein n=1 Tax=Streptomyces sp. MS06 TaxID=3385974 RepID=UPI0039A3DCD2
MTTANRPQLPPHGERSRYLRGCHCTPCRDANKRYCKQYRVRTIRRPIRIDAEPVRQRLQQWTDQGYSQTQIGDAVGKKSADISKLLNGQATIAPTIAARILRTSRPAGIPAKAVTESIGTLRRAQALYAIGYPIYRIAQGVPMAANHLSRLLGQQPDTVSLTVAQGMKALYEQLRWRSGPSHYAVHDARRRGYCGPLAWDDIDDPDCRPDIADPYKPTSKYERDPDKNAEILHLHLLGESNAQIAKQLGHNEKYIHDQLKTILRRRANRHPDPQQAAA